MLFYRVRNRHQNLQQFKRNVLNHIRFNNAKQMDEKFSRRIQRMDHIQRIYQHIVPRCYNIMNKKKCLAFENIMIFASQYNRNKSQSFRNQ